MTALYSILTSPKVIWQVLAASLFILQLSHAVIIRPNSNDPYITATLPSPANSIDDVTNAWNLIKPINAWGLALTLDAEEYGFQPGAADSRISIEVEMDCDRSECDAFFAFSIGDIKYLTWAMDLDGVLSMNTGTRGGLFAYGACNENLPLVTGDPSELLNDANDDFDKIREVMGGGQKMSTLTATNVGEQKTFKFEFINNDVDKTFTVRYSDSDKFQAGKDCVYQGAAPKCLDFKLYQTPDTNDKATAANPQVIKSYTVESTNTGWTNECSSGADVGGVCVDGETVQSIEYTTDSASSAEHAVSLYFNNKVYECNFRPTAAGSSQCTPTFNGNDCDGDNSIKLAISNPTADHAVFSDFKITTSKNWYGATSFCGTGDPFIFEITGTEYKNFKIPAQDPPVCGLGLLTNYKNVCIGDNAQCRPSTLVIKFDSNRPNEYIENALIEDDSALNKNLLQCCNNDDKCCEDDQCCAGSYCQDNGKCGAVPTPQPTAMTYEPTAGPITTTDPTTYEPTTWPTVNPITVRPTNNPTTAEPTKSPIKTEGGLTCAAKTTGSPTKEPTADPTTTTGPAATRDIKQCRSMQWANIDTVILNDVSCPLTTEECKDQQEQIAYALKSIKGPNTYLKSNVAYLEFDGVTVNPIVSLLEAPFNKAPITEEDIDDYFYKIKSSAVCNDAHISQRNANPNLEEAIDAAIQQFDDADTQNKRRDMKVMIFSNCKVDNVDRICNKYEDDIFASNKKYGGFGSFDAYMVNNGDRFDANNETYIMCLVEYDEQRLFTNSARDNVKYYDQILPDLTKTVCGSPTPGPTADPTKEPTSGGLPRRLVDESRSIIPEHQILRDDEPRRLQGFYDITKGSDRSPCITLQIKLETENLVPTNNNPDPASNIILIGKAIANVTGGVIQMPSIPDPEDAPTSPSYGEPKGQPKDQNPFGEIPNECRDDTQTDDSYFPKEQVRSTLQFKTIQETNGFRVTTNITTNDSIVYVFNVNELPLPISHSCNGALTMKAAIYQNNGLIAETTDVLVNANDANIKKFPFVPTVSLNSGTTYQFEFRSSNGYPTGCSFDDICIGSNCKRRRMAGDEYFSYDDFAAEANPNACTLGKNLAASPAMKTGVAAMCNPGLGDKRKDIEQGLFTQKCSQAAIKNHLFKTGSLYLYDESGTETFSTTSWPSGNVKEPCIAVDEDSRRIYAIGGYDNSSGFAVDTIQVFEFDDDTLKTGRALTELEGWKLDKPRYASTCFFWRESANQANIVVISGVPEKQHELSDKSKFFNDIRMFPIPKDKATLDFRTSTQVCGSKSWSKPSDDKGCASGTKYLVKKGVLDPRPLLYDNHVLYLFGGKTHKESKNFVSSIDLNTMSDYVPSDLEVMTILKKKAQPLIDQVEYDCAGEKKSCYMIFAGSTYNGSALIPQTDKELTSGLQLFCNDNIKAPGGRRRMKTESDANIPRMTEFDRQMLETGRRRRRLYPGTQEESEVFMRNYKYTLDGIWYNFTVNFELCYDDNDLLKNAEDYYENVIASKPDQQEWIDYAAETSEEILQESIDAYYGWSNGFGAVSVWDLDILSVNYEPTPAPTVTSKCELNKGQNGYRRLSDFKEPHDILMDTSIDDTIRRLQGSYDITSGLSGKSPCVTFEIELETENLVPANNNPDPASNIMLIGQAIANITGGKVTLPIFPDDEEPTPGGTSPTKSEPVTSDPFKEIVSQCGEDKTQITDMYWPKDTINPSLDGEIKDEGNGFSITTSITTEDSLIYVFNIDELPLKISHSCNSPLTMIATIYKNGDLVSQSEELSINANDVELKKFLFTSTVSLKASSTYSIEFRSSNGYPTGCSLSDICIGNNCKRRRMADDTYFSYDDFTASANPNACCLGKNLAASPAMKTGVNAMCNPGLGDKRKNIEQGLFTQKCSQTAIKNHLFKTGSLYIYDINGVETFSTLNWPSSNIKDPCIAVDEDGRRIFAIGGYDEPTGLGVDTIQVFKFDDDTLKSGSAVTELAAWKLDKKRYGSMCFYWKESANQDNIVVISGMEDKQYEFTDKSKFYNDIRIFPIPKDAAIINLRNQVCPGKSFSKPSDTKGCESTTKYVARKGVLDSRPFLYDNHKLYLFGGKTHKASKNFVTYFDLNDINNQNPVENELLTLVKQKAQPLIDEVEFNCGTTDNPQYASCYMVMMGSTYNNSQLIPKTGNELTNNLQLFCNPAITQPAFVGNERRRRRRLKTDDIPIISEYDRLMLEKGTRRRLLNGGQPQKNDESEVLMRKYEFGLDGLWYDFSVKFELCYENNEKLKDAENYYKNVIFSKPDGAEWIDYAQKTSKDILQVSLDAYYGWSNGFGAVNVLDLNILNINYNHIRSPSLTSNHPQRRNARWWSLNIEDKSNDFIWIDDKINCNQNHD